MLAAFLFVSLHVSRMAAPLQRQFSTCCSPTGARRHECRRFEVVSRRSFKFFSVADANAGGEVVFRHVHAFLSWTLGFSGRHFLPSHSVADADAGGEVVFCHVHPCLSWTLGFGGRQFLPSHSVKFPLLFLSLACCCFTKRLALTIDLLQVRVP